jgi:acyl carrier protein
VGCDIKEAMTRAEFLRSVDEILELPPGTLRGPEKLEDFPLWDSTAIISFMALADSNNRAKLAPRAIGACQTVEDLLGLAKVE